MSGFPVGAERSRPRRRGMCKGRVGRHRALIRPPPLLGHCPALCGQERAAKATKCRPEDWPQGWDVKDRRGAGLERLGASKTREPRPVPTTETASGQLWPITAQKRHGQNETPLFLRSSHSHTDHKPAVTETRLEREWFTPKMELQRGGSGHQGGLHGGGDA